MKKIQNVLNDYDSGKTDKLLRYSIDTEQQENPEFETKKNNKIIQNMEERTWNKYSNRIFDFFYTMKKPQKS